VVLHQRMTLHEPCVDPGPSTAGLRADVEAAPSRVGLTVNDAPTGLACELIPEGTRGDWRHLAAVNDKLVTKGAGLTQVGPYWTANSTDRLTRLKLVTAEATQAISFSLTLHGHHYNHVASICNTSLPADPRCERVARIF
jgi:hypothetical protein